jgi:hypothetical protein
VVAVFTPYSTGVSLFGTKPSWIPSELDQLRFQSYQLYPEIYWNVDEIFKLATRGTNDKPIYIPTARTIIDTTNRYTAPQFGVAVTSKTGVSTPDVIACQMILQDFMARERFKSKFSGAKRYGLIQGDWIWHVTADPSKTVGSRLSITALDPGMYFPIWADDDLDRVIGCHLVEQTFNEKGDAKIRRLTYRKADNGRVTVEDAVFGVDDWEGPNARPETILRAVEELPETITALPVYHVKNFEEPGNPFGSSEIRGFERIMAAINQSISDEDLALALDGIGMYATDAPHPTHPDTGARVPWQLGPGRVIHHPADSKFGRVSGVGSLGPFQDHLAFLINQLREGSNTPDIAVGNVDVKVAQSGIALSLQLSPMLAKASEKNELILDVHTQLFYDLVNGWYPAFEETTFTDVIVTPVCGDAVPVDRAARFTELNDMLDRGVIDTGYYRTEAAKLGYVFPEGMAEAAKTEFDGRNSVADPFAARVDAGLNDGTNTGPPA